MKQDGAQSRTHGPVERERPSRSERPAPSIARSSAVMAAGTLMSRILGLVRNALLISALGATASGAADAFNTANTVPTQLYNLLIGGILNAILVPQIVRALRQRNGEELVNRLLTAASLVIAAVAALLTVAAPLVIMAYASGLGRWQPLAFAFAFWCMPQIFFYGLYALWGQVLNARSSFGPYMWSPVLNNVISIASILAYLRIYGGYTSGQDPGIWDAGRIALIGATTTLGIAAQALILYIPLVRSGFRPKLILGVRGMGLGSMSKVALWALLGTGIVSLGDLAATNLGSRAVTAAESAAYADVIVPSTTMYANAQLVYMLPQSLITTSIITALFTRMSEKAAAGDREGVRDDLSLGLRSIAVFTVLFAAGIGTLAAPALQVFVPSLSLEQAGASAPILTVLAIGIVGQGIWFTMQRVMLAYADTKRLLIADTVVGLIPILVCLGAYLLAPANHWMVWAAVASATCQVAGFLILVPLIRRHLPDLDGPRVVGTYARLIVAALPAVLVGLGVRRLLGPTDGSLSGSRPVDALVTVLVAAVVMTVVYLAGARLLRVQELDVFFSPLSRIVTKVGRLLPGPVGRALVRAGRALAPTPTAPAGTEPEEALVLPPSFPPAVRPASAPSTPSIGFAPAAVWPADPARLAFNTQALPVVGGDLMADATPIGSGRYELLSTMPATLPRIVRHLGRDTILDRPVTVLMLTDATPHRREVLEAATRAVLVDDARIQRVYDVEAATPSFIVTEPMAGRTFASLVGTGLRAEQVRAIVGEAAQALDACSRRGLHHLNLAPESVRVRPDGTVQVSGIGVEAAALGLDARAAADPLAADRTDAHALVELLYFGLTGRWPGKRAGLPTAPMAGGAPVPPSQLARTPEDVDAALDRLVARTWGDPAAAPTSAAEIASALAPWDVTALSGLAASATSPGPAPEPPSESEPATAGAATAALSSMAGGVLARLRRRSTARVADTAAVGADASAAATASVGAADEAPPTPAAIGAPAPVTAADRPSAPVEQAAPEPSAQADNRFAPDLAAEEDEQERAVNRTTTAVLIAVLVAVLVGVFLAVNNLLGLAGVKFQDDDIPAAKTVPTASAAAPAPEQQKPQEEQEPAATITPASAQALDPFGDNDEHPENAYLVIDGATDQAWSSRFYYDASLAWKQGIGMEITLEQEAQVSGVDIQGTGTGGNVQVRATSAQDPTGGTLLAEGAFTEGTTSFEFEAASTQSIVLWVTDLPTAADGQYKLTISEITFK
ncbi:murein biosynthesis integral membrane protein MurJ [Actinomyces ruminicola]|uniref:Murein biosynthesis integral membrane protein MurJ n=1 Tax=Actinomyces ruminicola TaxID=332524 RepID=A0A1G9SAU9_9ACTO|nr:murein biosynthesis integral membrane protein MurJ [Actinomyces ruminicola]SDM32457.1 murein biosynthesis integral membrane protein MurJ [Actinomyces ruminicola]